MARPMPTPETVETLLDEGYDLGAAISALEPHWKDGKRPNFWASDEAKRLAIRLYGRATQRQTAAIMNERFGPDTTSQSAICRFWRHVLSKAVKAGLTV